MRVDGQKRSAEDTRFENLITNVVYAYIYPPSLIGHMHCVRTTTLHQRSMKLDLLDGQCTVLYLLIKLAVIDRKFSPPFQI